MLQSCSSLKILAAAWRCSQLPEDPRSWLTADCWWRLGLARGLRRTGLGKRHRSQTRVTRSCALQDHSFRHTAACRADSQGGTPGSCLALYFGPTPSVNERSTLASPFCVWSGTSPRGSLNLAHCSWWCCSKVGIIGLSWTTPLETVLIDRSPFWLVVLGIRTRRSGTSQVETVWLSWTTPL